MKPITAEGLLRMLARRYALAQHDQQQAGSSREHMVCGAEMLLLISIACNDLGATGEEWARAIDQAREESAHP